MKIFKMIIIVVCCLALTAGLAGFLVYRGVIRFNSPSLSGYPVRGIDVSAYQGDIDWSVLEEQAIDFAFIKATEGSDFTDSKFRVNFEKAGQTGIRIGAYHYFAFTSSGEDQARHFIETVPRIDGMLPPAVDVEFDAAKRKYMLDHDTVIRELKSLLEDLETHYGMKPIIYATFSTYRAYIKDHFDDYDLWIRNVYFNPVFMGIRGWTFWQYSDKVRLPSGAGQEKTLDMNVYAGTREKFLEYP